MGGVARSSPKRNRPAGVALRRRRQVVAVAVSAPALLSAACAPLDRRNGLGIWSGTPPAGVGP
ncbi:MAG: hypothetical protein M5R42_05590 [Rhodocyclaceae bacterium]|nr:hypothetical protein [Rhodocyclaceae bacterium]